MSIAQRDADTHTFPAYAWPGGYPIIYITADNGTLCPACANGKNGSDAHLPMDVLPKDVFDWDKSWILTGMGIYEEGPPLQCDHCNTDIESAYGDPDAEANTEVNPTTKPA